MIDRNAERLLGLVEDLLVTAQAHSGTLSLTQSEFDAGTVVRHCAEACAPAATARGIRLDCVADPSLLMTGDPGRIGQVVDNLVSNALKFTSPGGRVELLASREDSQIRIEVADTGMGIRRRASRLDRFSAPRAVTRRSQAGLASIAKAIVEAHNGNISFRSVEARTTFTVVLPSNAT